LQFADILGPALAIFYESIDGALLCSLIPVGPIEVVLIVSESTILPTPSSKIELGPGYDIERFGDVFIAI
jgi:hypothetical protein